MDLTGQDLYAAIAARVRELLPGRLEVYRLNHLRSAPEYARFMYEGAGWEMFLKGTSGAEVKLRYENQLWREAFCEAIVKLSSAIASKTEEP